MPQVMMKMFLKGTPSVAVLNDKDKSLEYILLIAESDEKDPLDLSCKALASMVEYRKAPDFPAIMVFKDLCQHLGMSAQKVRTLCRKHEIRADKSNKYTKEQAQYILLLSKTGK